MKELLNAFGYVGVRQVAGVLFGLVRSKVLATYLGTLGLGVVSQGTTLMRLLQNVSALGIGSGFMKLIAEYHADNDKERVNRTISTVLSLFGILGLIVIFLSYIFSDQISLWVFADSQYRWFVVAIAAASWFHVQYNFIGTIFRAMFKWRQFAAIAVIGYIINVFTTVGLIIWLDLQGAILSILVAQATNLVVSLLLLRTTLVIPEDLRFWRYKPNKEIFSRVLRFIGPLTTVSILPIISIIYVRGEIIRQISLGDNGIFQVVLGISVTYMGMLTIALNSYGVSKVTSVMKTPGEVTKIQNHELRLGIFVVTPIVIGLMALRDIWIPILYSPEFLAAGAFLIWQFGADFFRVLRQALNITLVPHERFGYMYFDSVLYWGGWMVLSKYLIPEIGLAAVPLGYFVVNFLSAAAAFVYQTRSVGFRLSDRNKILLGKAILLGSVGIIGGQLAEGILLRLSISAITLFILVVWMPTKNEYTDLLALVKEGFSKAGQAGLDKLDQ